MDSAAYLEQLLKKYEGSFDLYRDYEVGGRTFPAYGFYNSRDEKYVLSRDANLWTTQMFEHVLFLEQDTFTLEDLEDVRALLTDLMDPVLCRNGNKVPEKDHMISFLSVAVLVKETPTADVQEAIRKFKFGKTYALSFRGRSEAHLMVADLSAETVYTNKPAKYMTDLYQAAFE